MKTKTIAAVKKKKKTMGKQGPDTSPMYSFCAAEPPAHHATLRGETLDPPPTRPCTPPFFSSPYPRALDFSILNIASTKGLEFFLGI
jgi:hypothetical protein